MAGIQRFVTYIYAYDDGKKTMNAGYAKIEVRGDAGRIELHFMDGSIQRGEGRVAFVHTEEEKIYQLQVGVLPIERGTGMAHYAFAAENIVESKLKFSDMCGIAIIGSNQRLYASMWKDCGLERFYLEELKAYEAVEEAEEEQSVQAEEVSFTPTEEPHSKEILEEVEQESLHTMEIPVQNVFPICDMKDIWENLKRQKEKVLLDDNIEGIRIELKDLRELPKKYWYLGNNGFLLTGFFAHHYLILGRMSDGRWLLGVPGNCGRQERMIAPVFGFPGYCQNGVWYHILEE